KVFSIAADAKGRVYFADQRSGLGILENGEVTYFDSRDGLIHDTVQDIEIDEDGTVWLSTRGGLGGYRDGLWLSFGTGSGLQALELWPLATSGSLVYVGSAGKGTFVLDRSLTRGSPPRIVRMDPIVSDDEAVVRWATFADRGRQKRESIQTRHAIDGGQWSDWDLSREIGLHEMAAGRHEVSVQARDEFGTQDDGIKIEFFIESPYYQRPEFFVPLAMSLLAALLLSIALVVRRRRHNVDMRRTEDRFRSFFEEAPISLWEHDYSQVQQFLTSLQQPDIQALRAHLSDHPAQLFECMKRIHVLHVNRATLALFGAESTEELSGQLHRIFRRDSFPAFCEGMMAIHGDQHRFSAQTHAYALSGRPIVVVMSWVVAPDSTEDYKRVLVTLLDITAQHEAAEEMQQAVRVAQEANIAKSSFLANTSHEIRTPINAIMGMAQALQDEGLTEAAEDQVDTILSASDALTHIIDDLLDLSKIEAGELFLESLRFGLAEVIEEVRRTVVGGAAAKGLALAIDIAPGTDTDVVGDPVRIRQVLLNLLSNAIKFTDSGAVRVALSSQRHGTSILLRCAVEDSGMGINPDRLQDIFDPFTQADGSTTRLHGGTGLGLSICRRLVELMDGRIDVESVPGQGSTFRFSVRLQVPQGDEGSASVEVNLPPTSETPPLRILVAEDNELNLKVVRALLRSDHHDIDAVENGQLAVEACQNSGPYDAVLMDVQMPVMDGLTATQLIRKHELASGISRTPIIAVTANAMESDRERCLAAGMDDFVTKPVRKQALRRVLATLSPGTAPAAAIALDTPNQENTELLDPQPLEELRELAELDADFSIQGFVDLFLSEAPKTLAEAYSALDQADLEALHRHVHTLKGSAREIGATRLGLAAQTLEARLKVGDISNCRQSLAELEEILGHVAEALATMVSGDNEKG
ncbi:MAG: response regulator, partial [Gemmatimonadetes bacterium]|nr:response regulator [Gemmatimonadota bacterium]